MNNDQVSVAKIFGILLLGSLSSAKINCITVSVAKIFGILLLAMWYFIGCDYFIVSVAKIFGILLLVGNFSQEIQKFMFQ